MAKGDDCLLAQRILQGDRKAFEELLDTFETRVYRLALRFTGDVLDAEDLTQEIFLAVHASISRFRGDAALGTWIYRVAMNRCLEFRRKRRLETVSYEEGLPVDIEFSQEDPVHAVERRQLAEKVEAAISRLSPAHRDVVVLHELQGLTYQEVATVLNVPVGTVKSRLFNAFRRLRELLGGYIYEGTAT